jgi:hypothetical protein
MVSFIVCVLHSCAHRALQAYYHSKVELSLEQGVKAHMVVRRQSSHILSSFLPDDGKVVSPMQWPPFTPQEDPRYSERKKIASKNFCSLRITFMSALDLAKFAFQ